MPRVTVTTAGQLLASGPALRHVFTNSIVVQADADIYLGTSAALTADDDDVTGGFVLAAGGVYRDVLKRGQALYGRTATGTARVQILERQEGA